jgi:hypothetical protein
MAYNPSRIPTAQAIRYIDHKARPNNTLDYAMDIPHTTGELLVVFDVVHLTDPTVRVLYGQKYRAIDPKSLSGTEARLVLEFAEVQGSRHKITSDETHTLVVRGQNLPRQYVFFPGVFTCGTPSLDLLSLMKTNTGRFSYLT